MMSTKVGGPETLEMLDVDDPVAGKGQVVIDVKACSINYPDVLIIQDLYQFKPPRPFAPGGEVSGVISAVGEGVADLKIGDRVASTTGHGGLVSKVAVDQSAVFKIPDSVSFEDASALILTYGTSIHALVDRGHIKEGDVLLVLGASGGVGIAAVELGKAFGARVVAAVSSEEKAAFAKAAGADETVVYGRAPFDKDQSKALAAQFKAAVGPNGADVIYDAVGGDYSEPAVRSIAWEGRFLVVGFPAGIAKLPLNLTLLKSCDVCGVFWGAFAAREPKANRSHINRLFKLWGQGMIQPRVSEVFDFADAGKAIQKMADRGAIGKLVVKVAD
ncbi:NADPH:quinone oxidoreductase family protein [Parasphingorhabdus halotolerans]|uniref:NADPH:quinone oxidoreductase family protein n=1 Tax=Parasphingorhabdus halotolerans TaxID=2725558 RepID=A0A6H2DRX1_9SPHN|nr:NADPH:quinone oxidoreductase family protein [Parasphingorhabdus halotolerans]